MLAGKLAAGAGALEGEVAEVYLRLVGFAAAALAFAPEGCFVGAFGEPFGGSGEILAGFPGGVIGCEGKNLFFGEVQGSGVGAIKREYTIFSKIRRRAICVIWNWN